MTAGGPGRPRLSLIVAMGRNRVIGRDGAMPWHLPSDLARFRRLTLGKPLVIGRRTHQAIGRPLPGRTTLVVSSDPTIAEPGVRVIGDLDAALAEADRIARESGVGEVMVAGGGAVYAAVLARADRLHVTHVDLSPAGDTTFPPIDPATWTVVAEEAMARTAADEADALFTIYERTGGRSA